MICVFKSINRYFLVNLFQDETKQKLMLRYVKPAFCQASCWLLCFMSFVALLLLYSQDTCLLMCPNLKLQRALKAQTIIIEMSVSKFVQDQFQLRIDWMSAMVSTSANCKCQATN